MNSASRGLRPTVGLRRPGRCLLRRRRPTPGAQRLGRPISIGVKAFGRRSACVPNEFGLPGPSADGRPAPTGRVSFASAEADARRAAPWKADFNRREGLRPAVGLRRPGGCLLRRRRPTLGAQRLGRPISIGVKAFGRGRPAPTGRCLCVGGGRRLARSALGRPISIGVKAFGRRSACADRMNSASRGLGRNGRPAPTGRVSFASAEADAWRAAPWKADFNRRESLRRPGGCLLRRRRPTPGAQRLRRPISNRRESLRRPGGCLLRRRRPTPGAQRLGKADFNRRESRSALP
jgi:hypothetical protein